MPRIQSFPPVYETLKLDYPLLWTHEGTSFPPVYETLKPSLLQRLLRVQESFPPVYETLKPKKKKWENNLKAGRSRPSTRH